ncbi:mannosyltransferase, putative [Bodo saltans]|uniref:GPI mannosyltransferase 1 n=1 Tax=Bodo saltans TaxID=75058 RepID=A0A0S4JVL8_BODSA|nr:mannosyltransferase, putative [Bodo saltans]|eukprot:CUG93172.1 mannosyltransferase, putative [Bodo saltans]
MPSIGTLLTLGAVVRLVLMLYSVYHDRTYRVKYTDIDYMIITDGAAEMAAGGTPFDRATFRYTPLLSALMLPNVWWWLHSGKAFFALCDVGAAWYCYRIMISFATEKSAKVAVSLFILFNPIVVQVSTRGNSDMVVAFLSLAALANYFQRKFVISAMWLGFAIHFKLYPVIYALPFVLGLIEQRRVVTNGRVQHRSFVSATLAALPLILACGLAVVVLFALPTAVCYHFYGQRYLDDALLYHFHREDHRHNLSPYWLAMYLNQARRSLVVSQTVIESAGSHIAAVVANDYSAGWIAFVPQAAVLAYVSYVLRRNVAHACCVQTVIFVAFNKVCTVQYFVWFLPFLSFIFYTPRLSTIGGGATVSNAGTSPWVALFAVLLWALTIPLWIKAAYQVEFLGRNEYVMLWVTSCVFFLATVGLAAWLGRVALRMQRLLLLRGGEKVE